MSTTSTDLHIKYKMNTGESFQYKPRNEPKDHSGTGYNSEKGYTGAYAKWVEEEYLEELNDKEREIEEQTAYILSLEEDVRHYTSLSQAIEKDLYNS